MWALAGSRCVTQVVLQHLRPFAPIEVMNTRVCSKASPAPGNSGFEGCMEYLSRSCWAHRRALTIWDDAAFHFIDPSGKSSRLDKHDMLQLPLPMLRFVMKNMKSFTICCDGQRPPRELARSVLYCASWAAKQVTGECNFKVKRICRRHCPMSRLNKPIIESASLEHVRS